MPFAEDVRQARQDYRCSIRFSEEEIERYEAGDPDAIALEVARCYGAGTTVAKAIERLWVDVAEVWAMLEEVEDAAADHEGDLLHVISAAPEDHHSPLNYPRRLALFVRLYGEGRPHLEWLIRRAAVEAQMRYDLRGRGNWGDDTRWRKGKVARTLTVDPSDLVVDYTVIDGRDKLSTQEAMSEAALYASSKVAAIASFHEREGNEGPRAYWQHWLDRELSTLSRVSGVDFDLEVEADRLPTFKTIERWESEINVLDSEEQAKLRYWEAVCHFYYFDEEPDTEWSQRKADIEWAVHVADEAEESRLWAIKKRERIIHERDQSRRRVRSQHRRFSPVRRRHGARSRQSRGRAFRCGGSRRGASTCRSPSGDDPPGSSEPGERPRHVDLAPAPSATGFLLPAQEGGGVDV
jgi:hypothetical protein